MNRKHLPQPEVRELRDADAWDALITWFGVEEIDTTPMPLTQETPDVLEQDAKA